MNNIVSRLSYIFRRNNKEKIEIIESHMDEQVKEESIAVQINLPSEPGDEMPYSLLVVEDNQDLLALMTKVFSRVYNLYIARDGEEGLKVLENNKIDVIVSDIMMPGMDGLEFCRILKSDSHTADIPIVLLTAKVDEEDFVKGYDSGADGYITKPFSFAVLQAKIKNLINTHQRVIKESSENLIFGINKEAIPKPEKYDEVFLQKAIAFIQNHVNDAQFSHQQFIREMGVSKST